MTWLFDVNVLVAVADSSHIFHQSIHRWLANCEDKAWASCPITENGMVRVLSQPAYRGGMRSPAEAIAALRGMKSAQGWKHVFWGDDYSLSDAAAIACERITGTKQVTDVYLVGLACRKGGRLVTFDAGIAWQAVAGASRESIEIPSL